MASNPPPPKTRRQSGARQESSQKVLLHRAHETLEGWTLNTSRGGLRAVIEATLEAGELVEVQVAGGGAHPRVPAKIAWVQTEPDGQIVGLQFLGVEEGT